MVTKKQKLKIAVIGSSRYGEINNIYKKIAYDTGKAIANNGCILLTGGGKGKMVAFVLVFLPPITIKITSMYLKTQPILLTL